MAEIKTVSVPNISCGHCVMTIQRELGALAGVQDVKAEQESRQVTVTWNEATSWDAIKATLVEIGYPPAE
ncbi:MAG: cation transporter [Anaerolineae bacterium]|nr:cation transporter [Anaerolineae bacterium]